MNRFIKQAGRRIIRSVANMTYADMALQRFADTILEFEYRQRVETIASSVAERIELETRTKLMEYIASSHAEEVLDKEQRKKIDEIASIGKGIQILLSLKYKEILHKHLPLPSLADV